VGFHLLALHRQTLFSWYPNLLHDDKISQSSAAGWCDRDLAREDSTRRQHYLLPDVGSAPPAAVTPPPIVQPPVNQMVPPTMPPIASAAPKVAPVTAPVAAPVAAPSAGGAPGGGALQLAPAVAPGSQCRQITDWIQNSPSLSVWYNLLQVATFPKKMNRNSGWWIDDLCSV
jgi:hypothetical protein